MIFGSKLLETAKLGSQRITVKSSEVGWLPLLAESPIVDKIFYRSNSSKVIDVKTTNFNPHVRGGGGYQLDFEISLFRDPFYLQ